MTPLIVALIAVIMLLLGFLLGWFVEWRIDAEHWRSVTEAADQKEAATLNPLLVLPAADALQLPPASQDLLVKAVKEQLAQRDADILALRTTIEQLSATEAQRRAHEADLMDETRRLREEVDELTLARNDSDAEWRHELARREQQWQESKAGELADLQAENKRLQAECAEVKDRFEQFRAVHAAGLSTIRGIGPKLEADLRRMGINSYAELASRTPDELQLLLNPPKWRKLDFASWIAQAAVMAKNEAE